MNAVITKTYAAPPYDKREILRYARCGDDLDQINDLLSECLNELDGKLSYKVCYVSLGLKINNDECDFDVFTVKSKNLANHLTGCDKVIAFAATIGIEIDKLIAKYGRLAPSKALMFQAIGAERIENLCDLFCNEIEKEYNLKTKSRFSPGYGDLSLEVQKDLFSVLQCYKKTGLCLNESLLMSPSKSVTAFVGLSNGGCNGNANKCDDCAKTDCEYRSKK